MRRLVAGIDLGGTACRLVLWADGQVVASSTHATGAFSAETVEATSGRLVDAVVALLPDGQSLAGVGIGASGPVDPGSGVIRNTDTLPMFSDFSLADRVSASLHVPVVIDNDAVAAAIAEQRGGAGGGADRLLMVTLGTGIGVAFLQGGQPFRGPGRAHPEAGHFPILGGTGTCYCGAQGCWELMASRAALQASLRPHLPMDLPPHDILRAASAAIDVAAIRQAFATYGTLLGRGLATLHALYMPQVTVLGGSAASCFRHFGHDLANALTRKRGFAAEVAIRVAALGDNAGAIGGALMIERSLDAATP